VYCRTSLVTRTRLVLAVIHNVSVQAIDLAMLQRGLPAALQWAPAALSSAGCQLQQQLTAAQIGGSCGSPIATISSIVSSNSSSSSSSVEGPAFCLQQRRCFQGGVVDVRGQPRRKKLPYFNPDDGPEGEAALDALFRRLFVFEHIACASIWQ
jgi:hypothetical protein